MNWQKWVGATACGILIVSCFLHWAYYPDIDKHFTGFDTKVLYKGREVNYYGRPGILLTILGVVCGSFHLLNKVWAKRTNLFFAALCAAYAIKSFLMFSASYTGYEPQREAGLWIMLLASILNIAMAVTAKV